VSHRSHCNHFGAQFTQIWMGITSGLGTVCKIFPVFPRNKLPNFSAAYLVLPSKFSIIFLPSLSSYVVNSYVLADFVVLTKTALVRYTFIEGFSKLSDTQRNFGLKPIRYFQRRQVIILPGLIEAAIRVLN